MILASLYLDNIAKYFLIAFMLIFSASQKNFKPRLCMVVLSGK